MMSQSSMKFSAGHSAHSRLRQPATGADHGGIDDAEAVVVGEDVAVTVDGGDAAAVDGAVAAADIEGVAAAVDEIVVAAVVDDVAAAVVECVVAAVRELVMAAVVDAVAAAVVEVVTATHVLGATDVSSAKPLLHVAQLSASQLAQPKLMTAVQPPPGQSVQ